MTIARTELSRVWLLNGRATPARSPEYHGTWKAGSPSWSLGDLTTIRNPDPTAYGKFIRVSRTRGEPGDPEITISARYEMTRSLLLSIARRACDNDLQVHFGECKNPQDFNRGWEKILVIEGAAPQSYTAGDLGAMSPDEQAPINDELPFSGLDMYEIVPINFATMASSLVGREVKSVYVCDSVQCGACGRTGDGCQIVLAAVDPSAGSPGLLGEVVFTEDGGASWTETVVDSLGAAETIRAIRCIGSYVVVFSPDSDSLHYAELEDVLNGNETWAEVNTGFVATKGPRAVFSLGPTLNWIVGEGGYIYTMEDVASGVTVQDSGSNTVQDLNAVHGLDALNIIAVGNSNAVLVTRNGGISWASVVGPAVGVNLNAAWMRGTDEWLVGTANGKLYYTTDGGNSWILKAFTGSGAGVVRAIQFATPTVGYMAHSTATPAGRVLRTVDGGYSWYVLPEGTGAIPANDYIAAIATCNDPNVIFAGGLADDATDGILVKAA